MEQATYDLCCGIDVHKGLLVACVRSGQESDVRRFGATTTEIRDMVQWITESHCQMTVMESTGSCWIPVWNVFEELNVPVMLANAQTVRAVPGKKTDKADAIWLAQLLSEGHIQPSYVPDRKHRELRAIAVQRSKYIQERSAEVNRLQKILAMSNTQLSNFVSDVYGKSAQVLLRETLEHGTPTPERLRELQQKKEGVAQSAFNTRGTQRCPGWCHFRHHKVSA